MAEKLLDTKGISKPPRFSGKAEDWAQWIFRAESFGALLGWGNYMTIAATQADRVTNDNLSEAALQASRELYHFLVQTVDGRCLSLLRLIDRGCGFEAWRVITSANMSRKWVVGSLA